MGEQYQVLLADTFFKLGLLAYLYAGIGDVAQFTHGIDTRDAEKRLVY
jgi:hypothetical protein